MLIKRRAALIIGGACALAGAATAEPVPERALQDLAPSGTLRAAINFGNPVLASRDPDTGAPRGVSVALAMELGRQLGVKVALIPFDEAGKVFAAAKAAIWDVAFLAIDPARGTDIAFTAPYVLIEGCYLVWKPSPLLTIKDVDVGGNSVAVAEGSAYDLYLTRTLQYAHIVRLPNSDVALAAFRDDHMDVLAGVKQPLIKLAQNRRWRLLDGSFMSIAQAIGTPQGRPAGLAFLQSFIAQAKASGFVGEALRASGHGDVTVPDA